MRRKVCKMISSYRRSWAALLFWVVIAISFPIAAAAQSPDAQKPPAKSSKTKTEDPRLVRWKVFLDALSQEARSVSPEERRPYAVAEVAGAYWEVDREESQAMFIAALDAAWRLAEKDKKYDDTLDHVLKTASKLDISLAKLLTKRLAEKPGAKKNRGDISGSNALELLKDDPQLAARLAEEFAPDGLPLSALNLIYGLARVDVTLADRVHGVYVDKVAMDSDISLESMLPLCPYAFGYSEYYTMDNAGGSYGMILVPVKGIVPNPRSAAILLNLAFQRITREIELRNTAVGADIEKRTWGILFATQYLMPEVARFSPASMAAWQLLDERGRTGATPGQLSEVEMRLNSLYSTRARTQAIAESADKLDELAEAPLADVEKIAGTCERDVIYLKAALFFSDRKNFKRSQELASKIEGEKRAESIKNQLHYDMALADIEAGEWDEADVHIKKVSSPELKAIAQVRMTEALIGKSDKIAAGKAADTAASSIERLSEAKDRAGLYFSLASLLQKTDRGESRGYFEKGIKNLNKLAPDDEIRYVFLSQVITNCKDDGKTGEWYGGVETIPGSTVFDAVRLFAREDADETNSAVEAVADKITRIRAQAIVAKIALQGLKKQPNRW